MIKPLKIYALPDHISILSTKKLKPDLVRNALRDGFAIMDHDFISINFTGFPANNLEETLVFTSSNAVVAFAMNRGTIHQHKAYCLEGETLQTLSKLGNIQIAGVSANALSLAKRIAADIHGSKLSFICSHQRRNDLPDFLKSHGIDIDEIKVYETLHAGFRVAEPYEAVLFFSPSGVESFFQTNVLPPGIPCFSIGETTALTAKEYTGNLIITATQSTQEDMLKTVTEFFNKNPSKRNANDKRRNAQYSKAINK